MKKRERRGSNTLQPVTIQTAGCTVYTVAGYLQELLIRGEVESVSPKLSSIEKSVIREKLV